MTTLILHVYMRTVSLSILSVNVRAKFLISFAFAWGVTKSANTAIDFHNKSEKKV